MDLLNIDEDPWLTEFSNLERLQHQIAEQITTRDSRNSSQEYNKISAKIRIQLKQFENELSQLGKKLKVQKGLTDHERERRLRQLENLASKKVGLESRFQNTPGSSSRSQLFDRNQRLIDDDPNDEPMLSTAPIETLKDEQKQIIKEQDKGLDNLSQVIARQKKLAMRIGTEIEDQNVIIDNIAEHMDHTSDRVSSETRHVQNVSDRDSTFGYWLVIVCLFVAILLVGIL